MASLLNEKRPPVFCPGCGHETVARALDRSFASLGVKGSDVVIVSDIGCSGLFDTFFHTHAFHGLHGRALTYATGIKLARPELKVIVTMGDGGMGIGGAHLLSTCRRNIDLTLVVLNNFNYGMTGGQFSATTPPDALVGSGFLNRIENPMDICRVTAAAGAGYVARVSAYNRELALEIEKAVRFKGFSVLDLWGVCPGRYTKKNKLSPKSIQQSIDSLPAFSGPVDANHRGEYGERYRAAATESGPVPRALKVSKTLASPVHGRQEIMIVGSAGQRIVTGGEILCYAGLTAGLNAAQKNDYPITVLRGHSISEVILSPEAIAYTGIENPDAVLALGPEGAARRRAILGGLTKDTVVIQSADVPLPPSNGKIMTVDFQAAKIKPPDRALAALAMLAGLNSVLSMEMLKAALNIRFRGDVLKKALALIDKASAVPLDLATSK
ncbi:MAG: thiamine pyrophosphate-dependent enzyme [Deltaproteobacteria bacterium]|nr:thiamine pyrophosphate-dependent enzyme [Deltaproteobacteria bacterium]